MSHRMLVINCDGLILGAERPIGTFFILVTSVEFDELDRQTLLSLKWGWECMLLCCSDFFTKLIKFGASVEAEEKLEGDTWMLSLGGLAKLITVAGKLVKLLFEANPVDEQDKFDMLSV